jgi:hypothetical protein
MRGNVPQEVGQLTSRRHLERREHPRGRAGGLPRKACAGTGSGCSKYPQNFQVREFILIGFGGRESVGNFARIGGVGCGKRGFLGVKRHQECCPGACSDLKDRRAEEKDEWQTEPEQRVSQHDPLGIVRAPLLVESAENPEIFFLLWMYLQGCQAKTGKSGRIRKTGEGDRVPLTHPDRAIFRVSRNCQEPRRSPHLEVRVGSKMGRTRTGPRQRSRPSRSRWMVGELLPAKLSPSGDAVNPEP